MSEIRSFTPLCLQAVYEHGKAIYLTEQTSSVAHESGDRPFAKTISRWARVTV